MYRVKNFIRNVKRVFHWLPIIWKDRDWDYYFIYEMLKQKLIRVEAYILKDGIHLFNEADAASIRKAIEMIEEVQYEYHIDKFLSESKDWDNDKMMKAIEDHDKARKDLFEYLSNNIDQWWD